MEGKEWPKFRCPVGLYGSHDRAKDPEPTPVVAPVAANLRQRRSSFPPPGPDPDGNADTVVRPDWYYEAYGLSDPDDPESLRSATSIRATRILDKSVQQLINTPALRRINDGFLKLGVEWYNFLMMIDYFVNPHDNVLNEDQTRALIIGLFSEFVEMVIVLLEGKELNSTMHYLTPFAVKTARRLQAANKEKNLKELLKLQQKINRDYDAYVAVWILPEFLDFVSRRASKAKERKLDRQDFFDQYFNVE